MRKMLLSSKAKNNIAAGFFFFESVENGLHLRVYAGQGRFDDGYCQDRQQDSPSIVFDTSVVVID